MITLGKLGGGYWELGISFQLFCKYNIFPIYDLWKLWASQAAQWVRNPPAMQDTGDLDSVPESGRIPWRRAWQPTPVFLPGESHGQRSLDSPWDRKDRLQSKGLHRVGRDWSDWAHMHTHTHIYRLRNWSKGTWRLDGTIWCNVGSWTWSWIEGSSKIAEKNSTGKLNKGHTWAVCRQAVSYQY